MAEHTYDDQYYGVSNDDWRNLIDAADEFTGNSPVPWSSWGWDDAVGSSDPIDYWAFKINCAADTPTATHQYMVLWCVWVRNGTCATCW